MGEIIDLNTWRQQKLVQPQNGAQSCMPETALCVLFLGVFVDTESYKVIRAASSHLLLPDNTYQEFLVRAQNLSVTEAIAQLNEVSPDYIKNHPTWYIALWDRVKNHCEPSLHL